MICISRKARNATFRNYVAAETATPVIGCAACLPTEDAKQFYFAGVCRSKTVRPIDDGVGPSVDEFFTLAIGGMATLQNNSIPYGTDPTAIPGNERFIDIQVESTEGFPPGGVLRILEQQDRSALADDEWDLAVGRTYALALVQSLLALEGGVAHAERVMARAELGADDEAREDV